MRGHFQFQFLLLTRFDFGRTLAGMMPAGIMEPRALFPAAAEATRLKLKAESENRKSVRASSRRLPRWVAQSSRLRVVAASRRQHYGKPEEYRFYKGDPNNDIQPVSKEALLGAIRKCLETLWAASSRRRRLYEFQAMNSVPQNRNTGQNRCDGLNSQFHALRHMLQLNM